MACTHTLSTMSYNYGGWYLRADHQQRLEKQRKSISMRKPEENTNDVANDEDGADIYREAAQLLGFLDHVVLGNVTKHRCKHHR